MNDRTSPRSTARQAIADLAVAVDPGALAPHHRHDGQPLTRLELEDRPHPLAALRAGTELRAALRMELVAAALAARGDGESWHSVAEALGLYADGEPDADAAFLSTVGARAALLQPACVLWTCTACSGSVRDLGPELTDPTHRELGHGDDCARHVRDIIAWRSEAQR